ncbi:hypothetical protein CLF_107219 [Clonorchis sinensis]|uniref:Uncharacterized protein n=1 Tax=Clonorchis sinensis TaxID=79923 RepID=G7YGC7_CLOSI|nr:hypothetical protein CLF_107219 [Clonorchis sinensis]
MPTYTFPALCCDFTSLVARSIHTIRQPGNQKSPGIQELPVTFGSSVPLCPVFPTHNALFTQATTSCEDGLEGLSRLITPVLRRSEAA